MKTLLTITTLVFTLMFSSTSFAEWTKVGDTVGGGDTYYVDYERIRKVDGFVYFWELIDYLKPTSNGVLSTKRYYQVDCKLFRLRYLSHVYNKQPMGRGPSETYSPKNPEWYYPPPNSWDEFLLKSVCSR